LYGAAGDAFHEELHFLDAQALSVPLPADNVRDAQPETAILA